MDLKKYVNQQTAPSLIGAIGSTVWKVVGMGSNVDFLFSLGDRRTADLFQFVLVYGWGILFIISILWYIAEVRSDKTVYRPTAMLAISFMTALVCSDLLQYIPQQR